jgi:hypothetical protein
MDAGFMEGREHLKVYHQAPMAGLCRTEKSSTNLTKVKVNYRSWKERRKTLLRSEPSNEGRGRQRK